MDEEAASTYHAPHPQHDPPIPLKFSIPLLPHAGFFPFMSLEAFQAFTAYWYAQAQTQAQAQAQARQCQFLMPPMSTLVTPPTQPTLKLSKLVKIQDNWVVKPFLAL